MEAVVCTRPKYRWPLLFCPGSSFRSRLSLGGGTGNGPMISLRPSLITEHHSVSSLNDPAREASPCSRYLRPARDVDTTCTVGRNVHESMATKVRAHRAPNLLRGCVGRSDEWHVVLRNVLSYNMLWRIPRLIQQYHIICLLTIDRGIPEKMASEVI